MCRTAGISRGFGQRCEVALPGRGVVLAARGTAIDERASHHQECKDSSASHGADHTVLCTASHGKRNGTVVYLRRHPALIVALGATCGLTRMRSASADNELSGKQRFQEVNRSINRGINRVIDQLLGSE